MKINELRFTYGTKEAAEILDKKLSERERLELEEKIIEIQRNLNQNNDEYYYVFNDDTQEFELRLEQDVQLIHDIVAAILKLNDRIESISTSAVDRRGMTSIREKFLRHLRKLGANTLADNLI